MSSECELVIVNPIRKLNFDFADSSRMVSGPPSKWKSAKINDEPSRLTYSDLSGRTRTDRSCVGLSRLRARGAMRIPAWAQSPARYFIGATGPATTGGGAAESSDRAPNARKVPLVAATPRWRCGAVAKRSQWVTRTGSGNRSGRSDGAWAIRPGRKSLREFRPASPGL